MVTFAVTLAVGIFLIYMLYFGSKIIYHLRGIHYQQAMLNSILIAVFNIDMGKEKKEKKDDKVQV